MYSLIVKHSTKDKVTYLNKEILKLNGNEIQFY